MCLSLQKVRKLAARWRKPPLKFNVFNRAHPSNREPFSMEQRSHYICQALRILRRSQKKACYVRAHLSCGGQSVPRHFSRRVVFLQVWVRTASPAGSDCGGVPRRPARKEPLPEVEADAAAVRSPPTAVGQRGKTTPTINREEEQEDRGAFVSSRRENRKTSASERDAYFFSSWGRYFCFLTCSCRGRCVRNASFRSNKSSRSAASLGGRKEIPATGGSEQRP